MHARDQKMGESKRKNVCMTRDAQLIIEGKRNQEGRNAGIQKQPTILHSSDSNERNNRQQHESELPAESHHEHNRRDHLQEIPQQHGNVQLKKNHKRTRDISNRNERSRS